MTFYRRGTKRRILTRSHLLTGYYGCNTGAGSYLLDLECGHQKHVKASQVPRGPSTLCHECTPVRISRG